MKKQTTPKTNKKKYQKPAIVHTSRIQTLAGSCASTVSCEPNFS